MVVRSHHILLDKSNKQRTEILVRLSKCPDSSIYYPQRPCLQGVVGRNLLGLPQQLNSSSSRDGEWDIVFETVHWLVDAFCQAEDFLATPSNLLGCQSMSLGGNPLVCYQKSH